MSKVEEVANGFKNLVRSKMDLTTEAEEKLFNARTEICNACPLNNGLLCTKCFCVIKAKVKSINSVCPMGYW